MDIFSTVKLAIWALMKTMVITKFFVDVFDCLLLMYKLPYLIFSYDHVMLNNASQQVAPQPLSTHHIRPVVSANVLPFARGIPPRQINTAAPPVASHMMRLSKSGTVSAPPPTPAVDLAIQGLPPKLKVDDWVRAAEFVPGQKWQALSGE